MSRECVIFYFTESFYFEFPEVLSYHIAKRCTNNIVDSGGSFKWSRPVAYTGGGGCQGDLTPHIKNKYLFKL